MKAIHLEEYGLPKKLTIEEVEKPTPKEDEVLVRIHSASINDWDWGLVRGKPFIIRLFFGLRHPKIHIPGVDISGTIVSLGNHVRSLNVGDEIYCDLSECGLGGFAEYVSVPEQICSKKPKNLSFNEAAALPHASTLALQGLANDGKIKNGQKILINGAGGGVGTLAIQILEHFDAEVTGVDSAEKLEMMKSLGYDHVIDYRNVDFTETGEQYDWILDTKTNRSSFKYARSLKKSGTYMTVGGTMPRLFEILCIGILLSLFSTKKLRVLALQANQGLDWVTKLVEDGKIKPVIDGPYPFEKIPELLQYFGEGKHKGKVVVEINP